MTEHDAAIGRRVRIISSSPEFSGRKATIITEPFWLKFSGDEWAVRVKYDDGGHGYGYVWPLTCLELVDPDNKPLPLPG